MTQSKLQKETDEMEVDEADGESSASDYERQAVSTISSQTQRISSQHKVRTSAKDRKIDSMLATPSTSSMTSSSQHKAIPEIPSNLISILGLRAAVKDKSHTSSYYAYTILNFYETDVITQGFEKFSMITRSLASSTSSRPCVLYSMVRSYSFSTTLPLGSSCQVSVGYSAELVLQSEELFYQVGLRKFGAYQRVALNPPPSLRKLVRIGLEAELKRRPTLNHSIEVHSMIVR